VFHVVPLKRELRGAEFLTVLEVALVELFSHLLETILIKANV
jgi:hypothetical protein